MERLQRKGTELNVSFRFGYKLDCIQKIWKSRPINKKPLHWKKIITMKSIQNRRNWTYSGSFFFDVGNNFYLMAMGPYETFLAQFVMSFLKTTE